MAVTLYGSGTTTPTVAVETSLQSITAEGVFQFSIDKSNMVAGDVLEIRIYRIALTGGTKRLAYFAGFYGAQPTYDVLTDSLPLRNDLTDTNSLQVTINQTFGTARAFAWKVMRETSGTAQTGDTYPLASGLRIKKNTALSAFPFRMVLSSDHITASTGATVTATRSLDGGAFAACANSATEVSVGQYIINLNATDTNANTVVFRFTAASSDDTFITVITSP